MKSICSTDREAAAKEPPLVSLSATGTEGAVLGLPAPERNAEQSIIAAEECARRLTVLEALFSEDQEAHMVILGDLDELGAAEIREMLGCDERELATIRRRIRRRIEKAIRLGQLA